MGVNIARCLVEMAENLSDKTAVYVSDGVWRDGRTNYNEWSFKTLNEESDRYAHGLKALGLKRGDRTLLMVSPGFEFIALTYALFKVGATSVLIDPGMGKENLLNCVKKSAPSAMIAVGRAHMARVIYRKFFNSVKINVTVGQKWFWGGTTLAKIRSDSSEPFDIADTKENDPASIIFTTGSTGPPKGVLYTHGVFDAQAKQIKKMYGVTDEDVDLPAFPLFALFSTALGMGVVIPDMDPTKPATVDPAKIVFAINEKGVTFTFGSPAIWRRVASYCVKHGVKLPTLKRVLMAGAPVESSIHKNLLSGVLPEDGETYTPYGATESLPVSDIKGSEILRETSKLTQKGGGVCVGYPAPSMDVRIIMINDYPIESWDDRGELLQGETGEIMVSGPVVTEKYFMEDEHNKNAKIKDAGGTTWHRMGDIGRFDEKGRLWFFGRKGQRVISGEKTYFTIPCETIFNQHESVYRTALVGIGSAPSQKPVIIAELESSSVGENRKKIADELLGLGAKSKLTEDIKDVLFHKEFPTDIRHNAKIFREKLKVWAEKEMAKTKQQ